MPPAASSPPADAGSYPARLSSGHATEPSVTVVATPEPEGPPSRKEASVTARPALAGLPRVAASDTLTKKSLAREYCNTAPYTLNRMMNVAATSRGTPKTPSRVM
jgi:hypothetical protein